MSADRVLIAPILIGDPARILAAVEELGRDVSAWSLIAKRGRHAAAARAVGDGAHGRAQAIMKHERRDPLRRASRRGGQEGRRPAHTVRVSHVFALDVPTLDELLFISDAAIKIAPDLLIKVDITQNAIDL